MPHAERISSLMIMAATCVVPPSSRGENSKRPLITSSPRHVRLNRWEGKRNIGLGGTRACATRSLLHWEIVTVARTSKYSGAGNPYRIPTPQEDPNDYITTSFMIAPFAPLKRDFVSFIVHVSQYASPSTFPVARAVHPTGLVETLAPV